MTKDEAQERFFEEVARQLDLWLDRAYDLASNPTAELRTWEPHRHRLNILQTTLAKHDAKDALRFLLLDTMSGLLHSVMVTLDGGTQLANEFKLSIRTSEGHLFGPGIHERFIDHLYETGRLPYQPNANG